MELIQRYGRTIQIGVALVAGILLIATNLKPQQTPPVGPVWEYVTVTTVPGGGSKATICYATPSGCRNDQSSDGGQDRMMIAAAKLGEKGWELTAATSGDAGPRPERTLYFRRLRSAINRGDSLSSR